MNMNVGIQNSALVAWNGTTALTREIGGYVRFGYVFEVTADLTDDVVFGVQAHDPSAADPCIPGPGVDVEDIPTCQGPMSGDGMAKFTLPAGTLKGAVCAGTLPCHPAKFISLKLISGTGASVLATLVRQGPVKV